MNLLKEKLPFEDWGLKNIKLRPYQIEGIEWYINCIRKSHGGILADEMGLGKTIQTICAILSFKQLFNYQKFIIICPLSVINNWKNELSEFAPNLKFIVYMGDKDNRAILRNSAEWKYDEFILLTTYEYLIKDCDIINDLKLEILFMDEGHRIKNNECALYKKVTEMSIKYRFLLTGTPIQNNLDELYNLLYMISPHNPILSNRSTFKKNIGSKLSMMGSDSMFDCIMKIDTDLSQLILRRIKANVLQDLPEKMEVLIFHGLTELQKKLYKSFLTKDVNIFRDLDIENKKESKSDNKQLLNILMQIRKCVLHPYLFSGIEKEPFRLGEHIVENSVKLQVIDKLLNYLIPLGHKILLFSQMTKMLDIIQDYCFLRGFEYERLDGSVRCEERFAAISKFTESKTTKLFLLSTRAGGQGLNLTAADTVIFVDSDFNPQVDLQAMARIHRPGQERPCRTIRLVAQHSVEEMIISRAQQKLAMTRTILGHEDGKKNGAPMKVKEMLCYGLDKLFSDNSDETKLDLSDNFFTSILGETDNLGRWQTPSTKPLPKTVENLDDMNHIYLFESCNYKTKATKKDYEKIIDLTKLEDRDSEINDKSRVKIRPPPAVVSQLEKNETINRKLEKKKNMWRDNNYNSCNVIFDSEEEDEPYDTVSEDSEDRRINYVVGDVTHPLGDDNKPKIICQLLDNSGFWGSGGVFSSIDLINADISIKYLRAVEMEDLSIGDTHIYPLTDNVEVALLVAQSRDKNGRLSAVRMNSLEKCIKTLKKYAMTKNASVHLPRLGYKTPQFNWYGVEKLINKHLTEKGIETFVYYYRRGNKRSSSNSSEISEIRKSKKIQRKLSEEYFDSCLNGVVVYFDKSVDEETKKELRRHVFALDGDVTESEVDNRVSHYVVGDEQVSVKREEDVSGISYVNLKWLIQSIQQRSKLPEYKFKF